MAVSRASVLLDNCAISDCYALGAWKALVARFQLETVEEVASEAATGDQHREIIDPRLFREQATVHGLTSSAVLAAQIEHEGLGGLDKGERDLWIHALSRTDSWILCGPDIASIRFGVEQGFADRLISLEELLDQIGFKTRSPLPTKQTKAWLRRIVGQFKVDAALGRSA